MNEEALDLLVNSLLSLDNLTLPELRQVQRRLAAIGDDYGVAASRRRLAQQMEVVVAKVAS